MVVRCIVCGKTVEVPVWDPLVDRCKVHPEHAHAYICASCRIRCQLDAKESQRSTYDRE